MAQASREGLLAAGGPDPAWCPRPFVITRAGYAGIQRHALVWTGDNSSNWDHLNDAVQMFLNLSLSGVPFCGGDVGGFLENTTPELFVRWFQFSTFTPFFRNHSNIRTIHQEPWAFGQPVEEICRTFLHLRYQLLPYLYALFAEARSTGAPIMRPLLWHYPNDPVAVACGDQFLLGRDLMIAPVLRQGAAARSVYLPNDTWIHFWTGERLVGGRHVVSETPLNMIPLYVRAGAILPFGPVQQFVGESTDDTLMLHCVPGPPGRLDWYEDDGETQAYEQGQCSRRTLTSRVKGRTWSLDLSPSEGPIASRVKTWRLVLWQARHKGRLRINGRPAPHDVVEDQDMIVADIPNDAGPIHVEYTAVG
jgi:alpha-glucosidase